MTSIMDELEGALNHIAVLERQLAGCQGRLAAAEAMAEELEVGLVACSREAARWWQRAQDHCEALEQARAEGRQEGAAEARERCAKIAEYVAHSTWEWDWQPGVDYAQKATGEKIAELIREDTE